MRSQRHDEEGTGLAAATAVAMTLGMALNKPTSFHADPPYLYLLQDLHPGLILFLGRVVAPRSRS